MKNLINFIQEKYLINNDIQMYTCHPEDKYELRDILEERLSKDKNANLNDIDVSKITNMTGLFKGLEPINIDISEWDVSNVEDMSYMFFNCENFNCDLSNWDVSNVEDMSYMFFNCITFTGNGLNNWKVKITNINKVSKMYAFAYHIHELPEWWKKLQKIV